VYDAVYLDVHPSVNLEELKSRISAMIRGVETLGYWSKLQDHYGNTVPLEYDFS